MIVASMYPHPAEVIESSTQGMPALSLIYDFFLFIHTNLETAGLQTILGGLQLSAWKEKTVNCIIKPSAEKAYNKIIEIISIDIV